MRNNDIEAPAFSEALYERIRELVLSARRTVARGVDLIQVLTNFEIGRHIVEHEQQGEQRASYGKTVIKTLSEKLSREFGRGFSKSNLEYMRRFFLLYQDRVENAQLETGHSLTDAAAILELREQPIAQFETGQLSGRFPTKQRPFGLSWTHYVFLMGIENADERRFYEIEAMAANWNPKELKRQFDSSLYERLALSRDKEGIRQLASEGQLVAEPKDLLKDPLVLEFLGLSEQYRYSESDLESAIINQLERFLLELGKGFLFEARQKRFTFDDEHSVCCCASGVPHGLYYPSCISKISRPITCKYL